ncbi:MAG: hypothetical protein N4J56_006755 [Chroococcidiopsis sp. SAG 2025]|uniref:PAS domain-containing protein n=1 Tax=Chroococcidiopsis sp. SAG 2025 TaxID=171389 RepID=UPI002936DD1C|nr:PAS domain-containing protein [Chroococcidiopsis sp. SAG 2025]MDV2997050.1 hypothetical protein [Chroococcidiopsis sp. SAG 2025]
MLDRITQLQQENDRLQAELAQLRESEKRYRTLFELGSEGIVRFGYKQPIPLTRSIDEQLELCYRSIYVAEANDAYARMFEYEKVEDTIGLTLNDFHDRHSEITQATMRNWIENQYACHSTETVEFDRHGRKRYFLNSAASTIENGCVVCTWVSQVDITQLRETQQALLEAEQARSQELERINTQLQQTLDLLTESEERYRTLFEISSEGIFRVEYEQPISLHLPIEKQIDWYYRYLRFAEGNATFAAMYGLDNPKDVIGMRLSDIHVAESEQNQDFMRALVENGYQLRNAETEEVDRYGNPRYFLNNIATIIKDGYAIGGWASQLDITELRLAQQALLKAEQERVAELAKTNAALKNSLDHLATELDLNAFLGHVLLEIGQQLQVDLGYLFFYEPNSQILELHMRITPEATELNHELEEDHPFSKSFSTEDLPIWNTLLQTRKPFLITHENAAEHVFRGTLEWQEQQQKHQAGINILLTLADEPIGFLVGL